ncbi:immunoglobulin domain-containing protein [Roseateles flavus]|uniref:Immunoglobulin domain-containing protein n=1 Tax=Roseateles flavus TaxID=3149041 RepID=A0ABV0GFK8_9BURK
MFARLLGAGLLAGALLCPQPGRAGPTSIALGDIDKGTFCYSEPLNLRADVSDIKAAFTASNWLTTITGVYGRRWPSGKALAQAQANDQYFKGFVDTGSFNKLAESLMVAIHEETHMWDLDGSRTQWNSYSSSWIDDTTQFLKFPLYDADGGFPRKEILALIKDDASSDMDNLYLKDSAQGDYHLQGVTAELNAGLMGLPASLAVAEFIDGIGASNARDIALTNLNYLQLYLRVAKSSHAGYYAKLKSDATWRKYVLVQFLRTAYFINQSDAYANKLGSSKVPALINRVYAPENLAILEDFSGYKFPTRISDTCMGSSTNTAPVISSQPQNVVVTAGQAASFGVTASGGGLSYQWRKNGSNVPANGNAATFSIASAQAADAGSYNVVVSNSLGSVSSSAASLTVNPAAVQISLSPANVTLNMGATQAFSATVTGSSNKTVTWSVVEADGGSISSSGLYTAPARLGTYHVKATSVADPSRSAQATVIVNGPTDSGTTVTGTLSAGGSTRLPSGSPGWWQVSTRYNFRFNLSGPSNADFDLYLYKYVNGSWTVVAKSEGPNSTEAISYVGEAGYYYLQLKSYSGSGSYTLKYSIYP